MAKPRKLPDKDTLHQLYVVEQLSPAEIAQRYSTTVNAVRYALERANLLVRSRRSLTPEEVVTVRRLYVKGMRLADIAAALNRSKGTISAFTRRQGWTRPKLPRGPRTKGE